ncbi:MAG: hypothetical protein WDZ85_00075 [Candidatus Paceibacterota bacterium]
MLNNFKNIFFRRRRLPSGGLSATNRGFSLIEVVVGASIIAGTLISIMIALQASINLSRYSVDSTQALYILEEGLEVMRHLRDQDWNNLAALTTETDYWLAFSGGAWQISQTENLLAGKFNRRVNLEAVYRDNDGRIAASGDLDEGTKRLIISVSWPDRNETRTKSITTYLADIKSE